MDKKSATPRDGVVIEPGVQMQVFSSVERPVAVALWRGAEAAPFAGFRVDGGNMRSWSLIENSDTSLFAHDKESSLTDVVARFHYIDGKVVGLDALRGGNAVVMQMHDKGIRYVKADIDLVVRHGAAEGFWDGRRFGALADAARYDKAALNSTIPEGIYTEAQAHSMARSKTYEVSLTYNDARPNAPQEMGYEFMEQCMLDEELAVLMNTLRLNEPSLGSAAERMWFSSVNPDSNGKTYSLHLSAVDGEPPSTQDYVDLGRMAGVSVNVPPEHAAARSWRVAVACTNANGSAELFIAEVEATQDQHDLGEHYDMARQMAIDEGYEEPFVCFDQEEIAALSSEAREFVRNPSGMSPSQVQAILASKSWAEGQVFVHSGEDGNFVVMKQVAPASCEMMTITNQGYMDVVTAYRFEQQELVDEVRSHMEARPEHDGPEPF